MQYHPCFAVANATNAPNLPAGTPLRSIAIKRLHIPHHPEPSFSDTVYSNPSQAAYNGCTVGFATTNPHVTPDPASLTADWSNTANDPRGDVPVGLLRGDTFDELDAALNKRFALPWERSTLQMRVQFYNVLNKTNFTVPGMTCCSTSFGRITSAYGPGRIGQIQARLMF